MHHHFLLIIFCFAIHSVTCQQFCRIGQVYDGLFSYGNDVFIYTRSDGMVLRLREFMEVWQGDRKHILNMFGRTQDNFESGFAIDRVIQCIRPWDPVCDKKQFLFNLTVMFSGLHYSSFRLKPEERFLDFQDLEEPINKNLMPFRYGVRGLINETKLSETENIWLEQVRAATYHRLDEKVVLIHQDTLWAGDVVMNNWRQHSQNPAYRNAFGAFTFHEEINFVINGFIWRLEGQNYTLRNTEVTFWNYFTCRTRTTATTTETTTTATSELTITTTVSVNIVTQTSTASTTREVIEVTTTEGGTITDQESELESTNATIWLMIVVVFVIVLLVTVFSAVVYFVKGKESKLFEKNPKIKHIKSLGEIDETASTVSDMSSVVTIDSETGSKLPKPLE